MSPQKTDEFSILTALIFVYLHFSPSLSCPKQAFPCACPYDRLAPANLAVATKEHIWIMEVKQMHEL